MPWSWTFNPKFSALITLALFELNDTYLNWFELVWTSFKECFELCSPIYIHSSLIHMCFSFLKSRKIWICWTIIETFFSFWAIWRTESFLLTLEACSFKAWTGFLRWQFFAALKVISTFFGRCRNSQFQKNRKLSISLPFPWWEFWRSPPYPRTILNWLFARASKRSTLCEKSLTRSGSHRFSPRNN